MPHLTADMVLKAPSFINPARERQLELRGKLISAIENLGTTQDQYDVLDLSDNEIGKLENFPLLLRLKCLYLNNNHINKIAPDLGDTLPNLDTIILANNRLVNLSDIDALIDLPKLSTLSLIDNVITKKANYRLYVIHKLPSLRLLDFRKIKRKEREESVKLFGEPAKRAAKRRPGALINKANKKAKTFTPGELPKTGHDVSKEQQAVISGEANTTTTTSTSSTAAAAPAQKAAPSPAATQLAVQAAVANAKTMEEVQRLERMLKTGGTPSPFTILPTHTQTTATSSSTSSDTTNGDTHMSDANA